MIDFKSFIYYFVIYSTTDANFFFFTYLCNEWHVFIFALHLLSIFSSIGFLYANCPVHCYRRRHDLAKTKSLNSFLFWFWFCVVRFLQMKQLFLRLFYFDASMCGSMCLILVSKSKKRKWLMHTNALSIHYPTIIVKVCTMHIASKLIQNIHNDRQQC